jgi:5'-methylthioadenosine phosphorylase
MAEVTIGVIGGSGLYAMQELSDIEEARFTTPYGDPSDSYTLGTLAGQRVAFLPRHGRGHRLLPGEVNARANIYGFKQLGVKYLISVSAVGSLQEELAPGHVVVPDNLFDRTRGFRADTFFGGGCVAHVGFDKPFCPILSERLHAAALDEGASAHKGGTLCVMEGPAFSTLAESEENRRRGFALIGMTALPEAKLAREAEIAYATLAMVTDYDCWHPHHESVTVEAVVAVLMANARLSQQIVARVVASLADGYVSPAHSALATAIITDRSLVPPATRERLALIAGKYL